MWPSMMPNVHARCLIDRLSSLTVDRVDALLGDAGTSATDDARSRLERLRWRRWDHWGPRRVSEGVEPAWRDMKPT